MYSDVKFDLKEEELKKTRQFFKNVTDEKEELLMKVKCIIFKTYSIFNTI